MRPDDHTLLTALFRTAIEAVHPRHLIPQTVTIEKDRLLVRPTLTLTLTGRLFLIGAGKGAGSMAQALMPVLGPRSIGGCVIIPSEQAVSGLSLPGIRVVQGEHPLPGPGSESRDPSAHRESLPGPTPRPRPVVSDRRGLQPARASRRRADACRQDPDQCGLAGMRGGYPWR